MLSKKTNYYINILIALIMVIQCFFCFNITAYAQGTGETKIQNLVKYESYKYYHELKNVPEDKYFTIEFSHPIDYKMVGRYYTSKDYNEVNNTSMELIEKETGQNITLVFNRIDDKELIVIPQELLIKGKQYYLIIHKTITTKDGKQTIKNGAIAPISVGDTNFNFFVNHANFISENQIEIEFNEELDYGSASMSKNYKVNNIEVNNVQILEDGKSVRLTLNQNITSKENTVFVSDSLLNMYNQRLGKNYTKRIKVIKTSYDHNEDYNKEVINGNVTILGENIVLKNVDVQGDIYIAKKGITLENVNVKGSIFIDHEGNSNTYFNHVISPRVEVLSDSSESILNNYTINIKDSQIDSLLLKNNKGVSIKIQGTTDIFKTELEFLSYNTVYLDSTAGKDDSFGSVRVTKDSQAQGNVKLKGNFIQPIRIHSSATLENETGQVDNVEIDMKTKEQVILKNNYNNVEIKTPVKVFLESANIGTMEINKSFTDIKKQGVSESVINKLVKKDALRDIIIDPNIKVLESTIISN